MIMLLHDVCDVLMELAKMFNYLKLEAVSTTFFLAFTGSWIGLRLYYFPFFIVNSTLFISPTILGFRFPFYWTLNVLLIGLCIMHVYWFSLILKILWMAVTKRAISDVREEDDDD